jgi:hypothetical protein
MAQRKYNDIRCVCNYVIYNYLKANIHLAASYLSRPMALSSMMVPTFTLNCFFGWFGSHSQLLVREEMNLFAIARWADQ